ncbi:MAG: NnrS family protein [Burkholderiaceae bacterium]|nr:NnrS family protein [Burkholderiaceae bacterium]
MNHPVTPIAGAPARRAAPPPLRGLPVLRLGMRPFYLGAAAFAAISVPWWVAAVLGFVAVPTALPPMLWHAHEMLFGFASAVIVGFLLSAGKAWTGLTVARGPALGGLTILWLAARIAAVTAPYAVYALLDALLLPLVAALLGAVLLRAGNRRNLPLVALLMLLSVANAAFHLAWLDLIEIPAIRALHAALALIVLITSVMGGRVIPAFTMGATPGLKLRPARRLEPVVLGTSAVALAWWVLAPPGPWGALAFGAAAAAHAMRLAGWQSRVTRGRPILWILHVSYAWLPIGFALLGLAQAGLVAPSAGVHALAVGAIGGLTLGMMTRTARGHTGRPLSVTALEVTAYVLVLAAAVLRALVPLAAPQPIVLIAAAAAWSSAFALYLWVFVPWLTSTRLDGKDG